MDALDAMTVACTIPEIQRVMVATGASKSKSDARYKTKVTLHINSYVYNCAYVMLQCIYNVAMRYQLRYTVLYI